MDAVEQVHPAGEMIGSLPHAHELAYVAGEDVISLTRWFVGYGLFVCLAWGLLIYLISQQPWPWSDWLSFKKVPDTFARTDVHIKLLGMAMYLSLCCTFIPLPTGWMVAAMATREAAVIYPFLPSLLGLLPAGLAQSPLFLAVGTGVLVGLAGAVGSTAANLNDYHIITLLLRNGKVARIRDTRLYHAAVRGFAKSPFFLVFVFNLLPIPVDVVRWLATIYRYSRDSFAAANFIGRFWRYFLIAFVTFYWNLKWIAPVALLALGAVLALVRVLPPFVRHMREKRRLADAPT